MIGNPSMKWENRPPVILKRWLDKPLTTIAAHSSMDQFFLSLGILSKR